MTKAYFVDDKRYTTICSIHAEIKNIFQLLKTINSSDYKTPNDLNLFIQDIIRYGEDYVEVALIMGQNMENALKREKEPFNYLGLDQNALNDNLDETYNCNKQFEEEIGIGI